MSTKVEHPGVQTIQKITSGEESGSELSSGGESGDGTEEQKKNKEKEMVGSRRNCDS